MKTKILLPLCILFCLQLKAQITLEHDYSSEGYPTLIQFKYAGDKYYLRTDSGFVLYNLNHTLYKNITIPPDTFTGNVTSSFFYISENLFDTDSSTIDYFLWRRNQFQGYPAGQYTLAGNEVGNIYFYSADSLISQYVIGLRPGTNSYNQYGGFVFQTDSGAKLVLSNYNGGHTYLFSLPGNLYIPCPCTADELGMGIPHNGTTERCKLNSYPNPSVNKTTVAYTLPSGIHQGELKIISMTGVVVKSYKITDAFSTIELDNSELPSGNYFYQVVLPDGTGDAKKMMVIH